VFGGSSSGYVTGTFTKGGGFKIDHPVDPANKILYHSFVESPDMKNLYDGVVTLDANGQATVTLPDYFGTLNSDFRYQLTAIGAPMPNLHVASKVANNRFTIDGGTPNAEVSWTVTGIRQDAFAKANRMPSEVDKAPEDKGRYILPPVFGQPATQTMTEEKQPPPSPPPTVTFSTGEPIAPPTAATGRKPGLA
jgi:hypothetical protein